MGNKSKNKKTKCEYKTVSLPIILLKKIENYVAKSEGSYSSVPEFIRSAIRIKLNKHKEKN